MSNDMILISSALPDFLKDAGGYRDEGMTAGIAPKAPKLSVTTSKQWTLTDNGQTVIQQTTITDAQNRQQVVPATSMRGVIIAASGTLTKAWYEKAYVPGTNAAPDCFSNDGKVPAPGVAKPQCSNCAQCPKNAFGSHPVTGRGKACGDRKMVVVALESMPDKYATFNLPTMSLSSLRDIDGKLKSANIPLQSVVMEFSFDPSITYPVVKIGAVGYLANSTMFEKFRADSDSDEVRQLLREVDYEPGAEAPAAAVVPANQIAFGSGTQTQQEPEAPKEPELTPKEKAAAALRAQLAALEEEDDEEQDPAVGTQDGAVNTAATTPAPTGRKRRTKAEMEAARAAENNAANSTAQGDGQSQVRADAGSDTLGALGIVQQTQQQDLTQAQQQRDPEPQVQQQQSSGGTPNVLDLLSKWQTK